MSDFERALPTHRLVQIHHGDTLQAIADRELGDANRWQELVWVNSLVPPYITDDTALASKKVLLSGSYIRIPAPTGVTASDQGRGQVFERDVRMDKKQLQVDLSGDLDVTSGAANLRQQLQHRINTPRGQAIRHPEYGCLIWQLLGTASGPIAGMLGSEYVKSALRADYRVSSVLSSTASVVGDRVLIEAQAKAIEGSVVDVVTG